MKDLTLTKFSELAASKNPTPGGGGVCALVSSLAASLSQMVTNLTIGKKNYLQYDQELNAYKNELEQLRIKLLECIDLDAKAFEPLSKAYALPIETENRNEILEKCLIDAADSPYQILLLTKRIIEIDSRLALIGSKISVSDAGSSVMIAKSCLSVAYINILVNTSLMKDTVYANTLNEKSLQIVNEYSIIAQETFDSICKRISK